jgi:hypothetical protein
MIITRAWAMPNSNTFSVKPIYQLIQKYISNKGIVVDPFARNSPFKNICITNDLNPEFEADYHMDALDFLKTINRADMVLFDPPYSPRQVAECYKHTGKQVNMQTTQASFWGNIKKEIARIVDGDGVVISFGWNSGGIGSVSGFEILEILLVAHGGWHNDTICTVERKIQNELDSH